MLRSLLQKQQPELGMLPVAVAAEEGGEEGGVAKVEVVTSARVMRDPRQASLSSSGSSDSISHRNSKLTLSTTSSSSTLCQPLSTRSPRAVTAAAEQGGLAKVPVVETM